MSPRLSLKVATKSSFRDNKIKKIACLWLYSQAKTEELNQNDWSVSEKSGIIKLCSAPYFLEVHLPVSLKAATKACFRGKKSENLDF